ncbi:MAG: hypothetical protein RLN79_13540 [Cytophagales bacterium]
MGAFISSKNLAQVMGTSAISLGGISNTQSDIYSVFNNPALLDYSKNKEFSSFYYLPYGIPELDFISFCAKIPNKHASIGLGLFNTGTNFFKQQAIMLSMGRKTENFSFGFSSEYRQVNINENGIYSGLLFNLAASSSIFPKFNFSMLLTNLNQAGIGIEKKEYFPTQVKISGKYEASEKLFMYSETEIQLDEGIVFRSGLEYFVLKNLTFRTGIDSKNMNPAMGFSLIGRRWSYNQSIDYHQNLGFSHAVNISYVINR